MRQKVLEMIRFLFITLYRPNYFPLSLLQNPLFRVTAVRGFLCYLLYSKLVPFSGSRSMDIRKRGRPEPGFSLNGGFKKSKQEMESLSTGVGSKSKPCTKFFSTAGCPFGEGCHFLHYVPGGYNAVAHMMNLTPAAPLPPTRNVAALPHVPNGSAPSAVKTRICNKFNTAEGCKFGDKCHFAHGEWELGKHIAPSFDDHRAMGPPGAGRLAGRMEPPGPAASFGANSTAKISVEASLAGAIIGKGGVNSKQICRQTGAKLSIREHESDPNLRNIELEGSFEQIKEASNMVKDLLLTLQMSAPPKTTPGVPGAPASHGSNFKTKLCENFAKGSCTFGDRCHFAHGASELRKSGV
ncbi:Zinc finger CCCH domain-containing protein 14 isoform C [Glycine soja]|uniref:Zinc finger CCCH domain-containing protein 14 isoform C n=1 Tax=Glycine soja TaxID=3848 RepID=A0A445LBI5_GLYSO|nr:Zinc finger CCCH domain-containing protein 14 isoform C [Glycine soja]